MIGWNDIEGTRTRPFFASEWLSEPRYDMWPQPDPGACHHPTLYYRHTRTGREVALAGVQHVSGPDSWEVLRRELRAWMDSGGVVHHEGQDYFAAGRRARARSDAWHWLTDRAETLSEDGVFKGEWGVGQHSLLEDPVLHATFQRFDSTTEHTFRSVSALVMVLTGIILSLPSVKWALRRRGVTSETLGVWLEDAGIVPSSVQMIDERDEAAVAAIVSESRPVIAIWGAAHLPGMDRLLQGHGYELQHWRSRRAY